MEIVNNSKHQLSAHSSSVFMQPVTGGQRGACKLQGSVGASLSL